MIKSCKKCNKEFRVPPSKAGVRRFCSKKCYYDSVRGKRTLSEEMKKRISKTLTGRKASEETKKKMSQVRRGRFLGEEHPNWRGGIYPEHRRIRKSIEYKLWRSSVFVRDNRTCIWCGSKEKIEADHIKPFADFPELRFAIDNGRTLCHECHLTTETYGRRVKQPPMMGEVAAA